MEIATANPLLNLAAALGQSPNGVNTTKPGTFAVKRRWDDGAWPFFFLPSFRSTLPILFLLLALDLFLLLFLFLFTVRVLGLEGEGREGRRLTRRVSPTTDLIFKNQAVNIRDKDKDPQFVNDLLRTEFHKYVRPTVAPVHVIWFLTGVCAYVRTRRPQKVHGEVHQGMSYVRGLIVRVGLLNLTLGSSHSEPSFVVRLRPPLCISFAWDIAMDVSSDTHRTL